MEDISACLGNGPPTKICHAKFCRPLKKGDCDTSLAERFNWCRNKFVVDRIEAGQAVLENSATLEIITIPLTGLPPNTRPGDTLISQNGRWYFDHAETEARRQRINERFEKIKIKNKKMFDKL